MWECHSPLYARNKNGNLSSGRHFDVVRLVWGWGVLLAKGTTYSYFISCSCCFVSYFISVHSKKQFSQNLRSRWFLYLFLTCHLLLTDDDVWQVRTPPSRKFYTWSTMSMARCIAKLYTLLVSKCVYMKVRH